jgi:K+-sensing histidine kinase KdpD
MRRQADEAHQRGREIEQLYKFSQKLLAEGNVIQLMNAIPNYIVESFEGGAAELFLPQKDKFYSLDSAPRTSMKRK